MFHLFADLTLRLFYHKIYVNLLKPVTRKACDK